MAHPPRPIAYVLAASAHGPMIVNHNDKHMQQVGNELRGYGVGFQILMRSAFDPDEVALVLRLLESRRKHFGDGVVAIDGGANIGVHTVEWARHMHGWGRVLAFEAQEVVFYALAGNVALNNCLNARVRCAALGERPGEMQVPQPDYMRPGSFGSLELRQRERTEFIGQKVSYDPANCAAVPVVSIDSLGLDRLDLFKLDVEGMEEEVLRGAASVLARLRPILLIEVIKSNVEGLRALLAPLGYQMHGMGLNMLAVHRDDPTWGDVTRRGPTVKVFELRGG